MKGWTGPIVFGLALGVGAFIVKRAHEKASKKPPVSADQAPPPKASPPKQAQPQAAPADPSAPLPGQIPLKDNMHYEPGPAQADQSATAATSFYSNGVEGWMRSGIK